jgi:transcriptional regulator with XRE-family HTH domain
MERTRSEPARGARAAAQIRHYRNSREMSLRELAQHSGISASQLSKIESGKAKLTVETALKLAGILQVPAALFLREPRHEVTARRSVTRRAQGTKHTMPGMKLEVLCAEFKEKHQLFWKVKISAKSLEENGGWRQHPGQEFLYVLAGALELHSQHYDQIVLKAGDSILFDADQPHAYVAVDGPAELLMMNSISE